MIVLDTNVVSELIRPQRDENVVSWATSMSPQDMCVTAVTVAELLAGIAFLPTGRRREELASIVRSFLAGLGREPLAFDEAAAEEYAEIAAWQRRKGLSYGQLDNQISATCKAWSMPLATRNVPDFEGLGLHLINPWEPQKR